MSTHVSLNYVHINMKMMEPSKCKFFSNMLYSCHIFRANNKIYWNMRARSIIRLKYEFFKPTKMVTMWEDQIVDGYCTKTCNNLRFKLSPLGIPWQIMWLFTCCLNSYKLQTLMEHWILIKLVQILDLSYFLIFRYTTITEKEKIMPWKRNHYISLEVLL